MKNIASSVRIANDATPMRALTPKLMEEIKEHKIAIIRLHLTLLNVSSCSSGLLANYCQ
jgi:hypothetical protein